MSGLLLIALILLGLALLLGARQLKTRPRPQPTPPELPLAEQIDAVLPQTQCTQCGYKGCRPYAEAIAKGEADINQCPPGGDEGIAKLAALLGRDPKPLDTSHGEHKPKRLALIDESVCIGCTLCIQACPVDAILGSAKHMHTVIRSECTGCELCVAPCPVDCISMVDPDAPVKIRRRYPVFPIKIQAGSRPDRA
ncbi:electron transport complex subunit RsxB [Parachitinimonas caeni]|uniref:Electron transport complex subunit RsxB n=1 Tax=Parachitinimonas caeni TaxID=3031301 RepID=A0ABT7DY92_9NEIS|nr:electron transport complex subunit RsxB [Parachitinimonas caeni]MDK2123627.1 electron transport complex subunit RsxB [Parachitinimonas caeni]